MVVSGNGGTTLILLPPEVLLEPEARLARVAWVVFGRSFGRRLTGRNFTSGNCDQLLNTAFAEIKIDKVTRNIFGYIEYDMH